MDNSKRFVVAGGGDTGTQLDSGQNSLDGKEGDAQEDGQDFVTRALNPFGKLYSSSLNTPLRVHHHAWTRQQPYGRKVLYQTRSLTWGSW
jgi:hypothetical protein